MTAGQFTFCSGLAPLRLTMITTILFLKKGNYILKSAACASAEAGRTQCLQNGYPSEQETVR